MTWSDCDCDEYIIRLMNEWMCNFVHLSESESVMRSSSSSVLISSSSSICVVSYSIISSSCKWDSPSMNEANLQKRRINGFFFFWYFNRGRIYCSTIRKEWTHRCGFFRRDIIRHGLLSGLLQYALSSSRAFVVSKTDWAWNSSLDKSFAFGGNLRILKHVQHKFTIF